MKNSRLKIEFRQKQLYRDLDTGDPIIVNCVSGVPVYEDGTVDVPDWVDMTEFVEGTNDLNLSWTAAGDDPGQADTGGNDVGSNYQKGLSSTLVCMGAAFDFIYNWLMSSECQILNAVEVRITDLDCADEDGNPKVYRVFEIKVDNIHYKEKEPCRVEVPLREMDDVIHAFQKTPIEDNWQNWFNETGTSTKDHPTFAIVIEKKPKLILAAFAALIYIAGILSCGVLVALNEGKKWIRRMLGILYFSPSPLIRTYIENICSKYGYTFDTIFDDVPENPYRDLCHFFPASKTYKNFDGLTSPSTKYIWENRTDLAFSKFLNQLKKLFNAEWYVTPNSKLVFKHKSFFDNQAPLYDFTVLGNDKIYDLEYSFNGKKKAAYGDYQYQIDPQDTSSNEVKWRYNDIVDYDGPANNPMLEGHITKSFDFAMTAFHNDGSSEDYLEEGVKLGRTIAELAILIGLGVIVFAANPLTAVVMLGAFTFGYTQVNGFVNDFFNSPTLNGMVRTSASEINIQRLLLWDRETPLDQAKVVGPENPDPNPYYNIGTYPLFTTDYYEEHPAHDADPGYFGTIVTKVYNYPMYIDAKFTGNLFDRFHEYDNPLKNPLLNQSWSGNVDLCCEWLDRLGVWEGDFIKIGYVLTLAKRGSRYIKGRIEGIKPNYKTGRIELNGTVLK